MPLPTLFRPIVLLLCLAGMLVSARADVTDRLGVSGPLVFDSVEYELAWSANPSPGYFKQEYVPAGQRVEDYVAMVLVEAAQAVDVRGALSAQLTMLGQRKGSDPLVNYDVIRNEQTGEALLDFIVSDRNDRGEMVAEWNAYRYTPLPEGQGVLLFAISHRAYGDDGVRAFLGNLRAMRPDRINKLARQALPRVTLPR